MRRAPRPRAFRSPPRAPRKTTLESRVIALCAMFCPKSCETGSAMFRTARIPTAASSGGNLRLHILSAALVALCGALAAPAALAGSDYPPGLFENSPVVGPGGQAPANPAAPQAAPNPDRPGPDRQGPPIPTPTNLVRPGPRAPMTPNPDRPIPAALRRPTRPTPRRPTPPPRDHPGRSRPPTTFATASGCGPSAASRTSGGRTRSAIIVGERQVIRAGFAKVSRSRSRSAADDPGAC